MDKIDKKILIIEDEEAMLKALDDTLTNAGFSTIKATGGGEGLNSAFALHPDVILLDILMPKINGMEVLKKLREDAWGKTVPVIILTNVSPDSDAALNAVVEDQPAFYLIKSDIKLDFVVEKVKEVLKIETPPQV